MMMPSTMNHLSLLKLLPKRFMCRIFSLMESTGWVWACIYASNDVINQGPGSGSVLVYSRSVYPNPYLRKDRLPDPSSAR